MYFINNEDFVEQEYIIKNGVKTVMTISQLFGAAPYPTERILHREWKLSSTQKIFKIFQILWTITLFGTFCYCTRSIFSKTLDHEVSFSMILFRLQFVHLFVTMSMVMIVFQINLSKYQMFVESIRSLVQGIPLNKVQLIVETSVLRHRRLVLVLSVSVLLFLFFQFYTDNSYSLSFVAVGYSFIPEWMLILAITQFTFFATMSLETCKVMNEIVIDLIEKQNLSKSKKISYTLDIIRYKMLTIKTLLFDLGRLNGVLIVNTVLGNITGSGLELLEIYQYFQEPNYSTNEVVYFLYTVLYLIFMLLEVLLCLFPFHLVHKEITKMGLNLCNVNNKQLFEMSDRFSQQILVLCKKPVLCGIVSLDMRIGVTIVATLTTYFILMIQSKDVAERSLISF
ncbi:uncharacterized protein LOC129758579 isoform X1 [Uranotaenia lowii]|uniref:uncharacterized protein LOC129758579 isoform X1 n=2 Tax=Uranotaenia lowii TaxID=190385 RepID=UPI002479B77A|nr:uncharacterized protein LOC129758579 isoform X1 [Uranotaenia lowii]